MLKNLEQFSVSNHTKEMASIQKVDISPKMLIVVDINPGGSMLSFSQSQHHIPFSCFMRRSRTCLFLLVLLCCFELSFARELTARSFCDGFGGNVGVNGNIGGSMNDDAIMLLLLSSTSTTIYCVSIEEKRENRRTSLNLEHYSETNFAKLMEEGAKGGGEHLGALGVLMGCPPEAQTDFSQTIQDHFSDLFQAESPTREQQFLNHLSQLIQDHSTLKSDCFSTL